MNKITITTPPVAKGRPRISSRGGFARAYTPKKTRDYENLVSDAAKEHMGEKNPLEMPLDIRIICYRNVPSSWSKKKTRQALNQELYPITRPDVDNYAKAVLDGLNGVLFEDDSQIIKLTAEKYYAEEPRTEVLYAPMGNHGQW